MKKKGKGKGEVDVEGNKEEGRGERGSKIYRLICKNETTEERSSPPVFRSQRTFSLIRLVRDSQRVAAAPAL